MLERLEVHGKTYEPVTAVVFDLPFDAETLQQLARAKAVRAAFIDGQWFVDRDSVWQYHQELKNAETRRRQASGKMERAQHVKLLYRSQQAPPQRMLVWLQAATVVTCGLLVGVLFSSAYQNGVGVTQLQAGVVHAVNDISAGVAPMLSVWQELGRDLWPSQ